MADKFQLVKISGVVTGVGFNQVVRGGTHTEKICETLFDTGNDKADAADSEKWATKICDALNKLTKPNK